MIRIVLNIRKQYDDGKSLDQVEEALLETSNPVIITVNADGKQMTVNVGEALQDMNKAMHEQNKVIQSLVEHMQKQQEYIDTRLEERDEMLMAAIRENQESKKQMAADQEKEIMTSTRIKNGISFGNDNKTEKGELIFSSFFGKRKINTIFKHF